MYQKFWRLAALLLIGTAFSSCTGELEDNHCGNGVLDSEEICDAGLFAEWLEVDCDASKDLYFDRKLLKCTDTCELDITAACRSGRCGNGVIEKGEDCDSRMFPEIEFACENPKRSNLICQQCQIVDRGVCDTVKEPVCGDEELDAGEVCDGRIFKDGVRVCPTGLDLVDPLAFKCAPDCKSINTATACKLNVDPVTLCGNGVLDDAVGETCDGDKMLATAVNGIVCPAKTQLNKSLLTCKDCRIDSAEACVPEQNVLISEVVPYLVQSGDMVDIDALAIEISNEMNSNFDIGQCAFVGINSEGGTESISLSNLSLPNIKSKKSIVICDQKTSDRFKGLCTASVEKGKLVSYSLKHHLLALSCEDLGFIDIFNLNSFRAALNNGAVVFTRLCDALPVIEPVNALLGVGWNVDSSIAKAPTYGLGSHCISTSSEVADCRYTTDTTELSNRGEKVQLALEIKINGVTDKTIKNDELGDIKIDFRTGLIEQTEITMQAHHMVVNPQSDSAWTNDDGYDRYIGTLENWDSFQGFWNNETGQYTLDAAISFDQGKTFTYCGPKGIIKQYSKLDITERNVLSVHYDDKGGVCGDAIISSSEVCDGSFYRPEVLYCQDPYKIVQDPNNVLAYPEKLKCSCNMVSTNDACAMRTDKCGNGNIEDEEECDGLEIDHVKAAAKCSNDTVYYPERTHCRLNCEANTNAACLPDTHLIFNEFLVHYNDENVADGLALSIVLTSKTPLDTSVCSLSILDANKKSLAYISLADLLPPEEPDSIEECRAIRVCSTPTDTSEIFGNCDTMLGGNQLIKLLPNAQTFQLSCGGQVIDVFSAEGLRAAMHDHVSHGIAKERLPWPSIYSVLSERMTLTHDVDISTIDFGKDCVAR